MRLGEGLFERTLATLRDCGAGREECVVFWTGPLEEPLLVDGLLHPRHSAARGGYEIDQGWLARAWVELGVKCQTIRVQIHTHPREAFHSATDDAFPVVGTAGFLSLVLPRFAAPPQTLTDAYLARLRSDGEWSAHEPSSLIAMGAA
jgi:hypothetical protein